MTASTNSEANSAKKRDRCYDALRPVHRRTRGFARAGLAHRLALGESWRALSSRWVLGGGGSSFTGNRSHALEAAGIEFTNGDQPGVRLTKTPASGAVGHADAPKRKATAARGKAAK